MNYSGSKALAVAIIVGVGLILGNGFLGARKQAKQVAIESRCEQAHLWVTDAFRGVPVGERRGVPPRLEDECPWDLRSREW